MVEIKEHYLGHRKRLRQRLLSSPKNSVADYELLEMILYFANARSDMKPVAKELLAKFGSFSKVIHAEPEQLAEITGIKEAVIGTFRVIQEAAERLILTEVKNGNVLGSWKAVLDYARISMGYSTTEKFKLLYLNSNNELIADESQEYGTVDAVTVYPREIVKRALHHNASAVIIIHNHPSGNTTPSKADIELTHKIANALFAVGISLHDHLIISSESHYSFKYHGLIS